jgi:hypothetical protein
MGQCLIIHNDILKLQFYLFISGLVGHVTGMGTRKKVKKGENIPATGRGGPLGCETSRIPHFLENRLTDSGEVVGLTLRPPFVLQEDSWHSFVLEAESIPGP